MSDSILSDSILPPMRFGLLVGTFDHATRVPKGGTRPDNNHVYLWVRVPAGSPCAGVYECAFNIRSTNQSNVLFTEWPEDLMGELLPAAGWTELALSYAALGLKNTDFAPVHQGDLHTLVTQYAETCVLMAAHGTTYAEGTGLHDIHLNAGEQPGSGHASRISQDGALVFYFAGTVPTARWIFTKFDTQTLQSPALPRHRPLPR